MENRKKFMCFAAGFALATCLALGEKAFLANYFLIFGTPLVIMAVLSIYFWLKNNREMFRPTLKTKPKNQAQ